MLLRIAHHLMNPSRHAEITICILIGVLLIFGHYLVYATGGTHLSYLHFFYIPIVLAGFVFNIRGGVITGILAGVIIGPFLLDNIEHAAAQPHSSWINRLIFFALIGLAAGLGSLIFRSYLQELERRHTTDPVTGFPNINGLKTIFESLKIDNKPIAVAVMDLRHMGRVDRGLGVEGTNELIKQVANYLEESLGNTARIGHLHTKRFALIIPDDNNIAHVLDTCRDLPEQTFTVGSIPLFVETNLGVAFYPKDDANISDLVRKAQMVSAPPSPSGQIPYYQSKEELSPERNLLMLHQLKKAIENDSLDLHYQPKVSLKDNRTHAVEALVRWTDPVLGFVSPMDFIPLTEETLLINPFTKWLVRRSLKDLQTLHSRGYPLQMALNFSMKNFQDPSVIEVLTSELEKSGLASESLEIEVTETSVSINIKRVSEILGNLREQGLSIAVDDFGTGQSSQQYLFELPLDTIKIDRTFISAMLDNSGAHAIVKSAISLAHDLKLTVVAEGVETEDELNALREMNCDVVQGYLLAKPMPLDDLLYHLSAEKNLS